MTQGNLLIQAPRLPEHFRGGYRGAIDTLAVSLPETALHLQDVERIAPGIRPIRVTLSMLWEAFCRAIPGGGQQNDPAPRPRTSLSWAEAVQFA